MRNSGYIEQICVYIGMNANTHTCIYLMIGTILRLVVYAALSDIRVFWRVVHQLQLDTMYAARLLIINWSHGLIVYGFCIAPINVYGYILK